MSIGVPSPVFGPEPGVREVRQADPSALRRASAELTEPIRVLDHLMRLLAVVSGPWVWAGPTADAEAGARRGEIRLATELRAVLTQLARAFTAAAEGVERAQALLERAHESARSVGGWIDATGALAVPAPPSVPAVDAGAEMARVRREGEVRQIVRSLTSTAVLLFRDTDRVLSRTLARVGPQLGGVTGVLASLARADALSLRTSADVGADIGAPSLPHWVRDGPPSEVSAWWASLSGSARAQWLAQEPDLIGRLDGVPARVRHEANLVVLRIALAALRDKDFRTPTEERYLYELELVEQQLGAADGVRRQLLFLDFDDDLILAAVSQGDVDTAEHVGVFVGGFTTSVQDLALYDGHLLGLQRWVDQDPAFANSGSVATVVWMGYHAPQPEEVLSVDTVLQAGAAVRGAPGLARFVEGLSAARDGEVDVSVLAHSYGSVTLAAALPGALAAGRVAVFGGPGTGGLLSEAGDVGLPDDALNVLGNPGDFVFEWGSLVLSPTWEVVGERLLSSDLETSEPRRESEVGPDGLPLVSVSGHSDYFTWGSLSLRNLAAVVMGRADLEISETSRRAARTGSARQSGGLGTTSGQGPMPGQGTTPSRTFPVLKPRTGSS